MSYMPTPRGHQMLQSIHSTGRDDASLDTLPPWEASAQARGLRRVREALMNHALIRYRAGVGLELTAAGRRALAKTARMERKRK